MTQKQFQKAADTLIGTLLETLESYCLPEAQINTVKRVAWAEVDKQFGRYVDD